MLMEDCWQYHPNSRPAFTDIATRLDELLWSMDMDLLKAPTNILDMVFNSDRTGAYYFLIIYTYRFVLSAN
jgi:hypothetical protein